MTFSKEDCYCLGCKGLLETTPSSVFIKKTDCTIGIYINTNIDLTYQSNSFSKWIKNVTTND